VKNKSDKSPITRNGRPANLEAAALDCLEWLKYLRELDEVQSLSELTRLDAAIAAMDRFLPNKQIMWLADGGVRVKYKDGSENYFRIGEEIELRGRRASIFALSGRWAYVKGRRYQRTDLAKLKKVPPPQLYGPCFAEIVY